MQTEFDSRRLGSPRPGTLTSPASRWRIAPPAASPDGKPKAGNGKPVSRALDLLAPGIGWYSNTPTLVTYAVSPSGASAIAKGSRPTLMEDATRPFLVSTATTRKLA